MLADGASLTINGGIKEADSCTLTVYGQSGQTGQPTVYNNHNGEAGSTCNGGNGAGSDYYYNNPSIWWEAERGPNTNYDESGKGGDGGAGGKGGIVGWG